MKRDLITVDVKTTSLRDAEAALRQVLGSYKNPRVVALTAIGPNWWQWSSHIQLLAAIEFDD
ncbi:hypothetical protein ATY41_12110 [Leifsonia xyli subsp. xyli]|uniref:Uncharacterized protein n=2 Tax=Leifsonia xyli subsp. xyli TaxID=59736 RepID=Q6AEE3_LEIXX|nr:hypothetical protein [Leifsonia xyli]AAT89253.1 hypothetical protein Lxx14400 [Leifsonia xyli subsp. xyli str. CTCB07]ODA89861.1 hypothetical protein ATY41_12110 [Leifsonia xyli subsp. xyli]